MLGKGFDSCFRGVVGRIAGRVGDTLFTSRDYYGGRMRLAAETGEEGGYPVYDAEKVGVHDLA